MICQLRVLVVVLFAIMSPTMATAAPKAELWERWAAHDTSSAAVIDHGLWGAFLSKHVVADDDGVNKIAYGKVTPGDHGLLKKYLRVLSTTAISDFSQAEQMAYWINLYNALTVDVVLENFPVESILDIGISPGLFTVGPWGKKLVDVEGQSLSLDDIEHRILRPIWRDPRVHYAVNCASIGCPNLMSKPYQSSRLEADLDIAAKQFINSGRAVQVDGERVYVSSIYEWFKADFGNTSEGVLTHIRGFANSTLLTKLANHSRIADDFYDWDLNVLNEASATSAYEREPGSSTR